MAKPRKAKRPKKSKVEEHETRSDERRDAQAASTQMTGPQSADTQKTYMQKLNEALALMDDDPDVYNEFIVRCRTHEELKRLARDVDFLSHTTQHESQDEVYNIRGITGERRDALGRWLQVTRHPDHIEKEQTTPEEVAEWKEYQRVNPGSDRVVEHLRAPSEIPQILDASYTASGEVSGYTRSYPAKYELVKNIHYLLVEEWEESEEYEDLAAENGW